MKKTLGLLIILIIGLGSCKNQESPSAFREISIKQEFDSLIALLKTLDDSSQKLTVSSNKKTKVRGKGGTIIHVDPIDLSAEDGQPLGKTIDIELKELINQKDFLKANAQTISDGQLLMSGGAYYINMTSDGRQLKLKDKRGLKVEFPKLIENEMSLFYGQRDSLGQINWKEAAQKFEDVPKDSSYTEINESSETVWVIERESDLDIALDSTRASLTKEEKKKIKEQSKNYALSTQLYKAVEINQFGWINCDRFFEIPNKTNLQLAFNPKDSIVSAYAYLVFEDIKSVLQYPYFVMGDKTFNSGFNSIPVGSKTKLIVFSLKNGKIFSHKSDLTIEHNELIQLTMNEIPQDSLTSLFNFR